MKWKHPSGHLIWYLRGLQVTFFGTFLSLRSPDLVPTVDFSESFEGGFSQIQKYMTAMKLISGHLIWYGEHLSTPLPRGFPINRGNVFVPRAIDQSNQTGRSCVTPQIRTSAVLRQCRNATSQAQRLPFGFVLSRNSLFSAMAKPLRSTLKVAMFPVKVLASQCPSRDPCH